jgi:hypothetical protein
MHLNRNRIHDRALGLSHERGRLLPRDALVPDCAGLAYVDGNLHRDTRPPAACDRGQRETLPDAARADGSLLAAQRPASLDCRPPVLLR